MSRRIDFKAIAEEMDREDFRTWVEDNADDLADYAEEVFREKYADYRECSCGYSYEDLAKNAIAEVIDWMDFSDYASDDIDAEGVVSDVIFD